MVSRTAGKSLLCSAVILLMSFSFAFAAEEDFLSDIDSDILIQWQVISDAQTSVANRPDLTVYADGRVEVGSRFTASTQLVRTQLSNAELSALRHFVFIENNIWSINSLRLDQAIATIDRESAVHTENNTTILGTSAIADAGTTVIKVREGDRVKLVTHYNLAADTLAYDELEELSRLRKIEQRLIDLARKCSRVNGIMPADTKTKL